MKYAVMSLIAVVMLSGCTLLPGRQGEEARTLTESREMAQAIESGRPMQCVIMDPQGVEMEYQFKEGRMRALGIEMGERMGHMINDGDYIYIWEEGSSEGVMMAVPGEDEVERAKEWAQQYAGDMPDFDDEESVAAYEQRGYTIRCEPTAIGDEVFIPPATVNFRDTGAMMQEALREMQQQGLDESQLPPEAQQQMEQYREQMGL